MLVHIMVDEHMQTDGTWSIKKSCRKQVQGRLLRDLIAIFPFTEILKGLLSERICNLMYFLKVIRIYHGFELLDYKSYKNQLLEGQKKRVNGLLTDKETAEEKNKDSAKLSQIVLYI